jgi:hypothetical protein
MRFRMPKRALLVVLGVVASAAISWYGLFYFRDNFSTHYPLKAVSAAAYRHAEIPFWNSLAGGGQPLAGNPNAMTFYPDNLLYLFLPVPVAFNLHFLLHLVLAFVAMRALCRETGSHDPAASLAGLLYATSGLAISSTAFYNLIAAVALVPLAFCCAERFVRRPAFRESVFLGSACGLLGLVGEPVTVAATAAGIGIIFIAGQARAPGMAATSQPQAGDPRVPGAPIRVRLAFSALTTIAIAIAIASPQLIAYGEISREVERSVHPFSAHSVLVASLPAFRIAEIVVGPFQGLITDLGAHGFHPARGAYPPLFSSLLVGGAVIPAFFRKSARRRYQFLAMAMLFLGLGSSNPIVRAAVDSVALLRFGRYPEKLALPLIVALFVLIAGWLTSAKRIGALALTICALPLPLVAFDLVRRTGDGSGDAIAALGVAALAAALIARAVPARPGAPVAMLMLFPLVYWGARSLPIDRYAPYRDALAAAGALHGRRIAVTNNEGLPIPSAITARDEYRTRARLVHPLFGMAGGIRYALDRSPEGMYSFLSRIAHERFSVAPPWLAARYAALAGCDAIVSHVEVAGEIVPTIGSVSGTVADAVFVSNGMPAHSIQEAVRTIETPSFRPGVDAVIPPPARHFGAGRVTSLARSSDAIELTVVCDGDALLRLGESYWSAWTAVAVVLPGRSQTSAIPLRTLPVDLDRLGVIVPSGSWRVRIAFGRHRQLVAAAWLLSTLLVAAAAAAACRSRNSSAAPAR